MSNKKDLQVRKPAGPKTKIQNRRTINISLAAEHIEKARRIGLGNTSAGVRRAIDEYEAKE